MGSYVFQPYLPGYGYQTYSSPAPQDASIIYPQTVYVYQTPDYGDDVEAGMKAVAWRNLAEGEFSEAASIFAAMERQLPGKGWPKIGAGLIAGFNGNYSKANYNFQRGFRFDPEGPGQLPDEPALQEKLTIMVEHYRDIVSQSKKNEEAEFMLAASAYLAGDFPTARTAIEKAILHGDDSRGYRNLKTLVDQAGARFAQMEE
ncbi:MAG TPA: hypothetical protein VK633_01390 [Verrucomicrobiae bacterium]|nr:hypothetical protein [Verrucomicrobiae bacterium]